MVTAGIWIKQSRRGPRPHRKRSWCGGAMQISLSAISLSPFSALQQDSFTLPAQIDSMASIAGKVLTVLWQVET